MVDHKLPQLKRLVLLLGFTLFTLNIVCVGSEFVDDLSIILSSSTFFSNRAGELRVISFKIGKRKEYRD